MTDVFHAVADPVRRRILEVLAESERPAGRVAAEFPWLTREAVSRHLKVLGEAGLVEYRPDAQRRIYALSPKPLREVDAWLERYRAFWSGRLDALDIQVAKTKAKPKEKRRGRSR